MADGELEAGYAGRCESNVLSTDILAVGGDGDEMRGNLDEYMYSTGIDNIPAIFRFPVIQGRSDENNRHEHHGKAFGSWKVHAVITSD